MIDLLPLIPHAAGEERTTRAMREGTESTRLTRVPRPIRAHLNYAPVLQTIRLN